jgi:hypothetical protein
VKLRRNVPNETFAHKVNLRNL